MEEGYQNIKTTLECGFEKLEINKLKSRPFGIATLKKCNWAKRQVKPSFKAYILVINGYV